MMAAIVQSAVRGPHPLATDVGRPDGYRGEARGIDCERVVSQHHEVAK
jgi:hypothetical protein